MSDYWKKRNPTKHYSEQEYIYIGMQAVAARRVNQAIKNGTLCRDTKCWVCYKEEKTEAHHYKGYEYPFDIWWICRSCNVNLKGYHDNSLSLEAARRIIISKKFKKPEHYYKWLSKQKTSCNSCAVPDYIGNMALIYDDIEHGKWILCQQCLSQML